MLRLTTSGSFKNLETFFKKHQKVKLSSILSSYGQKGVAALASATPIDSGLTAESWSYQVEEKNGSSTISWSNSNDAGGVPLVILLQYGHGTRNGGYVVGKDFINPAIRPILDALAEGAWKEMTS